MSKHDEWIAKNELFLCFSPDGSDNGAHLIYAEDVREYLNSLHTYDPETHVVVPREPTEEMIDKAIENYLIGEGVSPKNFDIMEREMVRKWYKAIIKAGEDK